MLLKRFIFTLMVAVAAVLAQQSNSAQPAPAFIAEPSAQVTTLAETPQPEPQTQPVAQTNDSSAAPAKDESSTISVFVKTPEEIRAFQEDLKTLQTMAGGANPQIDSLMKRANRIAQMNDRCSMVSINEVLDTACGYFYEVELPAFENEYMEVTGEVRLGSMRMATTLEERTKQLMSCSEAITSIVISREQLLKLKGNVYLEPINFAGDFDAEYRFSLSYDSTRMAQQERLANLWISKCGDIVLRQTGEEFAPMFVATLKLKNDSLKKAGSNVKLMLNKKNLAVRVAMRHSVNGAYFLNGNKLFARELQSSDPSHLLFDIRGKKAVLEQGNSKVIEDFKGRVVFRGLKKTDMIGRWMWDDDKNFKEMANASVDESEKMTAEDSLAMKRGLEDIHDNENIEDDLDEMKAKEAAAKAANAEKNKKAKSGIRWIPFIASTAVLIGGGVMAFLGNKKAKDESDEYNDQLNKFRNDSYNGAVGDSPNDPYYSAHKDNVSKYQTIRNVGIGLAIAGGIGIGVSILF